MKAKYFFIPLLLFITFIFYSCSEEKTAISPVSNDVAQETSSYPDLVREGDYAVDQVTGTKFLVNPNLTTLLSNGVSKLLKTNFDDPPLGEWTDVSGRINIKIYRAHAPSVFYSQPKGHNRASIAVYIENDRVLIGGGAYTEFATGQPTQSGAYITKSYPAGSSLTCWAAQSKDHYWPNSPHTLYVFAIGLKVKNQNGTWMSRAALKNYINLYEHTSAPGTYISASAKPPVDFETIGGGVSINWGEENWHVNGNQLLYESHRENDNSWYVSSGSHMELATNTVTAFSIGVYKYSISGFGNFLFNHGRSSAYAPPYSITYCQFPTDPSWVPSCIGVKSGGTNYGRHVISMKYDYTPNARVNCITSDKDLVYEQGGTLYTYVTQIAAQ